jgi:antitoxin HicB
VRDKLTLKQYKSLEYKVVLERHKDEEVESYTAFIAELGRLACYGTGDTVEQALSMLAEVKDELLTYYYENGVTIPLPEEEDYDYSGKFVVRTGPELHKKLAQKAKQENQSLNSFVVAALSYAVTQPTASEFCPTTTNVRYRGFNTPSAPSVKQGGISKKEFPEAA